MSGSRSVRMGLRHCWLGALVTPIAGAQMASFEPLGVIGVPYATLVFPNSTATGVSGDGRVVSGWTDVWDDVQSVVVSTSLTWERGSGWIAWSAGGTLAVSADGVTTVGWAPGPVSLSNTPFFAVNDLPIATGIPSSPQGLFHAVCADGTIAAGSFGSDAIRWSAASGAATLGHIAGWGGAATAYGISADGAVIVGAEAQPTREQAFVWTGAGGMQGLGFYPGDGRSSRGNAVSADGRCIVGMSTNAAGRRSPFFWTAHGGMRLLPLMDGFVDGEALAVSGDGSVIVGREWNGELFSAYYWDRVRGRRELRAYLLSLGATGLAGWTLQYASGISADGRFIVGGGIDPSGYREGFLARVPAFCYANCDGSTTAPALNVNDFTCFLNRFVAGDPYANCDGSTVPPGLNVADFVCFLNRFAAGCP